jgi:hypothetical protein
METLVDYIQENRTFFIIYVLLFPPIAWGLWKYVQKTTPVGVDFDQLFKDEDDLEGGEYLDAE